MHGDQPFTFRQGLNIMPNALQSSGGDIGSSQEWNLLTWKSVLCSMVQADITDLGREAKPHLLGIFIQGNETPLNPRHFPCS
jgi:hypothetical protein